MANILESSESVIFDIQSIFDGTDYSDEEVDIELVMDNGYIDNGDGTYQRREESELRAAIQSAVWDEIDLTASWDDLGDGEAYSVDVWGIVGGGADFTLFGAMRGNPVTYTPESDGEPGDWLKREVAYHGYELIDMNDSDPDEWEVSIKMEGGIQVSQLRFDNAD